MRLYLGRTCFRRVARGNLSWEGMRRNQSFKEWEEILAGRGNDKSKGSGAEMSLVATGQAGQEHAGPCRPRERDGVFF